MLTLLGWVMIMSSLNYATAWRKLENKFKKFIVHIVTMYPITLLLVWIVSSLFGLDLL